MIFKTINTTIHKTAFSIEIKNIDMAPGHWTSEKYITNFFDELENSLVDKGQFATNIAKNAITLLQDNRRIRDVAFYRVPEENRIILLAITAVGQFKQSEIFSREITATYKKHGMKFSIVELIEDEEKLLKMGKTNIPETWQLDKDLNDKLEFMRMLSFA